MDRVYEEIKALKQSEKSTVQLVKEQGSEQLFIRKTLQGRHMVYRTLQGLSHPYLPNIYEVSFTDDSTTVVEEYIEGQTTGSAELSEKQCRIIGREICDVLIFLHENGIIHRDIKPSNILIAKDGHIRLIDFDAGGYLCAGRYFEAAFRKQGRKTTLQRLPFQMYQFGSG